MKNRMPHPARACLEARNWPTGNEAPVILHRLVDKFYAVTLWIIEMNQRGDKPLIGKLRHPSLDGDTSLVKPAGVDLEISLVVNLPPHKGKVITEFTGYREALFLIIHTKAERACSSVHQLHAQIFCGIIRPIWQIVRIDA
jgi:hypothetical protein